MEVSDSRNKEKNITPERRFSPVDSCVDYQSYIYAIDPGLTTQKYAVVRQQLTALGQVCEERMGVLYVRGPWGFFVIPQYGYPDLRVSFFHDTPITEINGLLSSICAVFDSNDDKFQPRSIG